MGPFTLLDFVGLDTTYYIANIMFEEYREPAYAPPPLLKRMVLAGRLGQEVRTGFLQVLTSDRLYAWSNVQPDARPQVRATQSREPAFLESRSSGAQSGSTARRGPSAAPRLRLLAFVDQRFGEEVQ